VAAYDCTFAAPKSVSLLHALAAPEVVAEVRAAHESSVRAALDFLENEAARVRSRRGGGDEIERIPGIAAASFLHRVSRAPDPHLHSHVLVANLGRHGDGRWSALDARPLFTNAGTAGALYRAQLRDELVQRLDVAWRWRDDGFADLAGVRPEVVRAFSRRSEAIARALVESGRSGRHATRVVADRTRPPKDLDVPYERLVEAWRERAYDEGISAGRVAAIAEPRRVRDDSVLASPRRAAAREVTARPFTRRELLAARSDELVDGGRVRDIVAGVDAELALATATGTITSDPQRATVTPTFHGRSGRSIPGGPGERVLVTREFLASEARVAAAISAAPDLDYPIAGAGLCVLAGARDDPIGTAQRLRQVLDDAVAQCRPVAVVGATSRWSRRDEALLGIEPGRIEELPMSLAGMVVVVRDAANIDPAAFSDLIERSRDASIIAVAGPPFSGRRVIAAALERRADASALEVIAPDAIDVGRRRSPDGRAVVERVSAGATVRLVDRPVDLAAAIVEERRRLTGLCGTALVVVDEPALAEQFTASTGLGVLRGSALAAGLSDAPRAGLVVLGGASGLPAALASDRSRSRVHVGVTPPGANAADIDRWSAHLLDSRRRTRSRRRDGRERVPDRVLSLGPSTIERAR
jgi:conjugative relaxase-like TrwC/TraI family protein